MKKATNVLAAVAAIGMFFTFAACSKTTDSASAGFTASRMTKPLDLTKKTNANIIELKKDVMAQAEGYPKGSEEAKWLNEQVRALTAAETITKSNYDFGASAGKNADAPSRIMAANLLAKDITAAKNGVNLGDKKLPTDSNAEGMEGVTVEWTAIGVAHCYTDKAADADNASIIITDKDRTDHKCECTIEKATGDNDGKFTLHATISCGGYKCTVTCGAGATPNNVDFEIPHKF